MFGIDKDKIKAAFKQYELQKPAAQGDTEKRLTALEDLIETLKQAFS